jgi:hypothetical protein
MKKLFLIAIVTFLSVHISHAQNTKVDAKSSQKGQPKQIPVKMAAKPMTAKDNKQGAVSSESQNTQTKDATTNQSQAKPVENTATQQGKPVMKKDGTPDKRYKENKNLKKDGTPDKRFKENKPTESKK